MLRRARRAAAELAVRVSRRLDPGRGLHPSGSDHVLVLEQPANVENVPRWGWGDGRPSHAGTAAVIAEHHRAYGERLADIERYGPDLAAIPREDGGGAEPCWENPLFIGIDGAGLYAFLRERNPRRYVEVGSGYSTKFAARAKRDGGLRTEIVSIDPGPQAEVDALCDRSIRERLEDIDLAFFDEIEPTDIVFFDGSHRVFMNNDVSTFWMDVMPRLPPGILVGVHDIFLPDDYPPGHAEMFWSEQYLMAVALLFGRGAIKPVLPCHYVCVEPRFRRELNEMWARIGLGGTNAYGSGFWFELDKSSR